MTIRSIVFTDDVLLIVAPALETRFTKLIDAEILQSLAGAFHLME
jgi:hypothetical protein